MDPVLQNPAVAAVAAKYADPEYQDVHINLFSKSIVRPIPHVLPPGVSQTNFDSAIREWSNALGSENVFSGDNVKEYIDPYELNEDASTRRVPSGAVWFGARYLGKIRCANASLTQSCYLGTSSDRTPDCQQV